MTATERQSLGWREWITATFGFAALSFLFCYPAGFSTSIVILGGDALASYFPYLLRSFQPVSSNVAGPWDPTILTGLPESHSPFGVYYPVTVLLYKLFPPGQALSLGLVFHHALAGLGAYLLGRTCRLSRSAAGLVGVVFGFGGFMVFHRGHVPIHHAAAWLPWALWGFERFRISGSLFWVAATGTLLTLHALSSLMQMIVMGGFVWLTYLAYFTLRGPDCEPANRERGDGVMSPFRPSMRRWRFLLGGLSACFLGAAGSLPQILPMLEVARWSGYGEFHADFFNDGYLKFRFLVGLAGPWVLGGNFGASSPNGYWGLTEHGIFYGVLPFTAALVTIIWFFVSSPWSVVRGRRRRKFAAAQRTTDNGLLTIGGDKEPRGQEKADPGVPISLSPCLPVSLSGLPTSKETGFWLVLFFESLVLMLGKTLAVHHLLAYLPIYQFFHMPTRHVWVMGLALAWLAGLGCDLLGKLEVVRRKHLLNQLAATLLVLAGIYVILIQWGTWPGRPNWRYPGFWIPGLCALAAFGVLNWLARRKSNRRWAGALVPMLAFLELALTIRNHDLTPISADVLTKPADFPEVAAWLREGERGSLPPRCLIRKEIWMTKEGPLTVPLGFGSAWGLSSLSYYTQSMPRSLIRLLQLDFYGSADFGGLLAEERGLSAAAGRYILARGPLPAFAPGLGARVELAEELVWKADDQSSGHPSPLSAGNVSSQSSTLVASMATVPGQTYLVEGFLPSQGPRPGTVRVVRTTRPSADILGEGIFLPSDYQAGGINFACVFDSGTLSGSFWITFECQDGQALSPPQINLWHLTADDASSARQADPRDVARKLRAGLGQPYPVLANLPDNLCVYKNPLARPLAGFVREVRPAKNDLDAAERITAPGPPVRDVAYVVAPDGQAQGWDISGPAYFEQGSAELHCQRPDDLTVTAANGSEGFLVLAITRCVGWSATIDGERVPIHAVDGPFMGVRVPAGEHTIHFQFRPVLMWAGAAVAVLFLGGAWTGVIVGTIRRRRARLQVVASLQGVRGGGVVMADGSPIFTIPASAGVRAQIGPSTHRSDPGLEQIKP
jgi:hypothetical protein